MYVGSPAELLHGPHRPVEQAAREVTVLELYRRGSISSGTVVELLAMDRLRVVRHASRLGIAFLDMTEDEWAAERSQAD